MTNREPTPADAVLVAIDISKLRNDVLIELPGAVRRQRLTVLNTRAEHDRFVELLGDLGRPVDCRLRGDRQLPSAARASAAARPASSCGWCRRSRWRERARRCTTAGTRTIRRMRRSSCTCSGSAPRRPTAIRSAPAFNDIQELSKTHEIVSNAKTELWHRLLTHYLPLYFPEIARFAGNSRSDWFLAFLEQFPTPASITALAKEEFVSAAWDVVGRKVSKARLLADIYETASSSIGLPVALGSPAIAMFRMVLAEGRSLIRQRDVDRGAGARPPLRERRLPSLAPDPRHRSDQCA